MDGEQDRQRSGDSGPRQSEDTKRGCDGGVRGVAQAAGGANGNQDNQEIERGQGEEGVTHSRHPNGDAGDSDARQVIDSVATEPLQAAQLLLHPPSSPEGGGPSGL